jgi:hypothetical protein
MAVLNLWLAVFFSSSYRLRSLPILVGESAEVRRFRETRTSSPELPRHHGGGEASTRLVTGAGSNQTLLHVKRGPMTPDATSLSHPTASSSQQDSIFRAVSLGCLSSSLLRNLFSFSLQGGGADEGKLLSIAPRHLVRPHGSQYGPHATPSVRMPILGVANAGRQKRLSKARIQKAT